MFFSTDTQGLYTADEVVKIYEEASAGRITNLQDLRDVIKGIYDLKTDFTTLIDLLPKPFYEKVDIVNNRFTVKHTPFFFNAWVMNNIVFLEDEDGYTTPYFGVEFDGKEGKLTGIEDETLINGKLHLTYYTIVPAYVYD